MNNYAFMLNFSLPRREDDPEHYLDALYEAGCSDASVGVGQKGMIGLDFTREAVTAEDALQSAIRDVQEAIPGAMLVQAGPDLVGLTEMAEIFSFTRQNMRKYATGQSSAKDAFPGPAIFNEPNLWHLAEIVSWLKLNTKVEPPQGIFEVSKVTARLNLKIENERVQRILELA